MGPNDILSKTFTAGGTITKRAIVKFSADNTVVVATSKFDLVAGVAIADAASGDRVDVQVLGIAEVKSAGTLVRGDFVVAGAAGDAVPGTAITAKQVAIGRAMVAAVTGDIIPVIIDVTQFDL